MILNLLEKVSRFTIDSSIREEALGDLWEADYLLESQDVSFVWRELSSLWCFLLLVKASVTILLEKLRDVLSRRQPSWFLSLDSSQVTELGELDEETLQTLRHYCDFRLHRSADQFKGVDSTQLSADKWRSSPLDKSNVDTKLLWLIQRADRVLDQCQSETGRQGDSESVINSLLLSHFIRRLEDNPPSQVDIATFSDLVRDVHLTREFIDRYVCFDAERFSRQLIVQTFSLTIYVISWEPGQIVPIHHHGTALDAIQVIQGELAQWVLPPEDWEKEIPFERAKLTERCSGTPEIYTAGEVALVDRRHAHQVGNLSDERLITLHFRFGQPPEDSSWRATADELKFVWEQIEFVWNKPMKQPVGL